MRASVIFCLFAVIATSNCKSLPEEDDDTVVSIYTTVPTTTKTTKHLDVYQQIATNLAERITSPIYRLLGLGKNKTENKINKRKWDTIELLDEPNEVMYKTNLDPMNNELDARDTEELSIEALKKDTKSVKPEKITLYSSYLPTKENIEQQNKTVNDIDGKFDDDDDEPFEFDDIEKDDEDKPRQNGFIYFLELMASLAQLAWGALMAVFSPRSSS